MRKEDNMKKVKASRSAENGRFVTKTFAKRNPKTTITETIKKRK